MNAPWVCDMRHMAQLDAEEERSYAIERLAAHIAGDPLTLATALSEADEDSPTLINLATALAAVWKAGQQATPEQSLVLAVCVQALADDHAARIWDCCSAD